MTTKSVAPANKKLWLAAIKPPMYSVAVMPIWIGTAVAYAETKTVNATIFFTFLTASILILAWMNISNDVFDSDTGIDKNKAHSLVNLIGDKTLIFWIGNFCLALGLLGALAISLWQQDPTVITIVLLGCALGYTYQGPPFRLGYLGLGELICFISFGPLEVSAAYYSQTQSISLTSLLASTILGLTTSLILFCSHFHQVEDDLAAGKRSPIVRLGTSFSAKLIPWFAASIYILPLLWIGLGQFPTWTLLIFISLPFAYQLTRHIQAYHDQPTKVSNSKFIAVALHFWSSILLGLGFVLPTAFHLQLL